MENLDLISAEQFAEAQSAKINRNFNKLKLAVENIPQGGGESGGGSINRTHTNVIPVTHLYDSEITSIKVLAVGNSFTYWPLLAFGAVAALSGSASSAYDLQTVCYSGTGLRGFCSGFSNSGTVAFYKHYGSAVNGVGSSASIKSALQAVSWDAVVFQQVSTEATDYTSYANYLPALIEAAKRYCPNQRIRIGWQMIWDKNHYDNNKDRALLLENTLKLRDDYDVDFVIPTGTAFENAWSSGLMPSKSSNFDAYGHTTGAESQFLASATWYQALYKLFLGQDIVDITTPLTAPVTWTGHSGASMSASAEYCKSAAKCAKAACEGMWNITENLV